ncbi:hypothetical protein ATANTOWER_001192 [Ataeniobius toweri]|uniref:Uncharacterized protein n=1 Tax=Ataeniobius toweri TaxID=208326 RepID=A0ABU7AM27_9TELE|nr:hypothetical protein [Ataeniobius toweri]
MSEAVRLFSNGSTPGREAIHSSAGSVTSVSCRPEGVSPSNNRHTFSLSITQRPQVSEQTWASCRASFARGLSYTV